MSATKEKTKYFLVSHFAPPIPHQYLDDEFIFPQVRAGYQIHQLIEAAGYWYDFNKENEDFEKVLREKYPHAHIYLLEGSFIVDDTQEGQQKRTNDDFFAAIERYFPERGSDNRKNIDSLLSELKEAGYFIISFSEGITAKKDIPGREAFILQFDSLGRFLSAETANKKRHFAYKDSSSSSSFNDMMSTKINGHWSLDYRYVVLAN